MRIKVNPIVFGVSAAVIVLFVILGMTMPDKMNEVFGAVQTFIVGELGWFYILAVAGFLIFTFAMLFSRYGDIRLGKDDEAPEFGTLTWFSMLFSAGMGIGLLFYSVAEPIMHFTGPPPRGIEAGTIEAAQQAMNITFFHWGLHAWGVYIIIGLSLAYFCYRHDLPLTIRWALYPILGEKTKGPLGDIVEIFAVFGTMFGLATSLGLGVMQINTGMEYLGFLDVSTTNQVILISVITLAATISVVTGLDKGVKILSEINMVLGLVLLLFVALAGPTVFILSSFVEGIGRYLDSVVSMTFLTDAYRGEKGAGWQSGWTMFYWGWWISWSPFVGMFIARISRGRTIRQFITGVLLVPTLLGFFWLTVYGGTALHFELAGDAGISTAVAESVPTALYVLLEKLPWSGITMVLATIVIATYFVTSSDSGSLVIDILTSDGDPHPPVAQRIFWAMTEGAVAAALLVTGGLKALQTASITMALPFTLIMILMCYSLVKGLRAEFRKIGIQRDADDGDIETVKHEDEEVAR